MSPTKNFTLSYIVAYGIFALTLFVGTWLWLTLTFGGPSGQLLTVTPRHPNTVLSLTELERLNHSPRLVYNQGETLVVGQSQVILSYRNTAPDHANALGVNHPVMRIGTNASLPMTADYKLVAGHFLRPQHLSERSHVAVLNRAAAFTLFGDESVGQLISLGGVTHVVIGIIDDGSEADDMRVYVPATLHYTHASEIVVNLNVNSQHSLDYVVALLGTVGVNEDSHELTRSEV